MISTSQKQSSFMDADYICDQLVPQDGLCRKFKEAVILDKGADSQQGVETKSGIVI